MRFTCPNDGPFDAEPEIRTTTPAKVKTNPVAREVTADEDYRDAATPGPELSPTHDFATGEHRQLVSIATGDPVEVTVGICPECGSPIVATPKDE